MPDRWMLHGVASSAIRDSIRILGLRPGPVSEFGEPAGAWVSNRLKTARWHAQPIESRRFLERSPDRSRLRMAELDEPRPQENDWLVLVIDVRGLTLHRHPLARGSYGGDQWYSTELIDSGRIVGTLDKLGVDRVLGSLWRGPRRTSNLP